MQQQTRGIAEMTIAMTISGTIGWFVVSAGLPVLNVVFWRCVFGALALVAICFYRGLLRPDALSRRQLSLCALGGVAVVLNWLLLFGAYSRSSISIATTVYNTQPFMLVGLGAILFQEKLSLTKLCWLALSFFGVLLLVWAVPETHQSASDYLLGMAMSLGAAFFYAVAALITKHLTGIAPMLIVLVQVVIGMVILAPLAGIQNLPAAPSTWAYLITLGTVHTGIVFILLYGAIQKLPTHLTGALSFIYPLVAILVDVLAFGHQLEPLQVLGGIAILLAAAGTTLGWSLPSRRQIALS